MLGKKVRLTAKGFLVRLWHLRISLRRASGDPGLRPVTIPRPPALLTAAASFAVPLLRFSDASVFQNITTHTHIIPPTCAELSLHYQRACNEYDYLVQPGPIFRELLSKLFG